MRHRPDIDGLRAFAILPVVLFHAGLGFPGGYIGVDVFFVISGYLITGIIARELGAGDFSLRKFWARRARRILPLLLLVVATTLLAGFFILLPRDFESLGAQALAALGSVSNFKFAASAGYWESQSDPIPMLHTWSLGIEEQFYLLMPLAMMAIQKYAGARRRPVLGAIALGSFLLAMWGFRDPNYHFYMLPYRAWELLLGSLVAISAGETETSPAGIARLGTWLGLAMIAASALLLGPNPRWPSWEALVPTLGAAMVLRWGGSAAPANRLLTWAPVRLVGLISYSFYLWHWPAIVLLKEFMYPAPVTAGLSAALVAVLGLVSIITWKYVEQPARNPARVPPKRFALGSAVGFAGVLALAAWVKGSHGGWDRFAAKNPPLALKILANPGVPAKYNASGKLERGGVFVGPLITPPRCVVLGDSHGTALGVLFEKLAMGYQIPTALLTQDGTCCLFAGTNTYVKSFLGDNATKRGRDDLVKRHINEWKPALVILCGNWRFQRTGHFSGDALAAPEAFSAAMGETLAWLKDHAKTVIVISQPPLLPVEDRNNAIGIYKRFKKNGYVMPALFEESGNRMARSAAHALFRARAECQFLDIEPLFLRPDGSINYYNENGLLYFDDDHLNPNGALTLAPLLQPWFQAVKDESAP